MSEINRLTWDDVNFDARCVILYTLYLRKRFWEIGPFLCFDKKRWTFV